MTEQPDHFRSGFVVNAELITHAKTLPKDVDVEVQVELRLTSGFESYDPRPIGKSGIYEFPKHRRSSVTYFYKSALSALDRLRDKGIDFDWVSYTRVYERKQIVQLHMQEDAAVIGFIDMPAATVSGLEDAIRDSRVLSKQRIMSITFAKLTTLDKH